MPAVVLALLSAVACSQPAEPPSQATPPIASRPAPPDEARRGGDSSRRDPAGTGAQAERARPPRTPATGAVAVDLERDERRGGHTIARHVGRTDAQLQARLARESIAAASTYPDLETAERIVARALAENARRVQRWVDLRGPRSNLAIRHRARDGLPTGRIMRRGEGRSVDAFGAVVVLRWRDGSPYVLTSYPENPR